MQITEELLEEKTREIFSQMEFYRDDDFIIVKKDRDCYNIEYISNHLSCADGESVGNVYGLLNQEGGQTFINFKIDTITETATCKQIHVREEYRERGIGPRLVKAMEDICYQFGVKVINVQNPLDKPWWINRGYLTDGDFKKNLSA